MEQQRKKHDVQNRHAQHVAVSLYAIYPSLLGSSSITSSMYIVYSLPLLTTVHACDVAEVNIDAPLKLWHYSDINLACNVNTAMTKVTKYKYK